MKLLILIFGLLLFYLPLYGQAEPRQTEIRLEINHNNIRSLGSSTYEKKLNSSTSIRFIGSSTSTKDLGSSTYFKTLASSTEFRDLGSSTRIKTLHSSSVVYRKT